MFPWHTHSLHISCPLAVKRTSNFVYLAFQLIPIRSTPTMTFFLSLFCGEESFYVKNQNNPSLLFWFCAVCTLASQILPLQTQRCDPSAQRSSTAECAQKRNQLNKLAARVMLLGRLLSIVHLLHSIQGLLHSSAALCTGDATSFPRASISFLPSYVC